MKKIILVIVSIIIIILAIFFNWYYNVSKEKRLIKNYNAEYEIYTNDNITGVDITTLINKAIDNNEKYSVLKNDKNTYIEDENNSMKIYVKVVADGEFYPMEAYTEAGINKFIKAYGGALFKCTSIEYHSNGKISKMNFEIII